MTQSKIKKTSATQNLLMKYFCDELNFPKVSLVLEHREVVLPLHMVLHVVGLQVHVTHLTNILIK